MYCVNLDSSGEHTNYLTTVSEQQDRFSDIDNKKAVLARYIQEYCAYHPTLILLTQLIKVELRSVGLTGGTSRLSMLSSDPPRLRWKERLTRERIRYHVIVV